MRVLFIGLGSIGKRHLEVLKNLENDVEIIAYRSNKNSEKVEGVRSYYSLDKALNKSPDIVFITNPTSLHIRYAKKCAEAGCNLFLEKPLSHNLNDCKHLINIVEEKELITLMGCNMRFNPVIKKIREIILNNEINNIYSYRIECGSYLPDWHLNEDYRESYSARKDLGGGVILDLIHEIDYAYWLFGEIESIQSYSGHISHLQINTEDVAEIILKNDTDVLGNIHLDYFRFNSKRNIEIISKNFIIEADLLNGELNIKYNDKNIRYEYDFDSNYMYEQQMKYFLKCVKNNEQTFNDIKDGYKVLKIALKARESRFK